MLSVLGDAESYGLRSVDYSIDSQVRAVDMGAADGITVARLDQSLTVASVRFVKHLYSGRITARAAGFNLPSAKASDQPKDIARRLATSNDLTKTLESFEPRPQPYRLLKHALTRYRQLAKQLMPVPLPRPPKPIEIGADYEGAPALRRLLLALGDLPADEARAHQDERRVDDSLGEAVRRFQDRHGLKSDGVLGPQTLAALNVPMSHRVRQIELSLERWRWLAPLGRPDIIVNIPQFMLYALPRPQRSEALLEMPVIVGRPHNRTPVFVAGIEEVIFHPYWDVPGSITRKELLPKIRQDASFLERHHFEIVRGGGDSVTVVKPTNAALDALQAGQLRLRQRPGPDNALGPVKFVLPNPYEVRLHGTSEPQLFNQSRRAFSHGCIRVSDPAALAEYVLAYAPENWDIAAVEKALCETQTHRVKLQKPVRVVIFYTTAAATTSRGVLFSTDIYGHDARLAKLLQTARHQ